MKLLLLFFCLLALMSCSDEIGGTQTGNPATISLQYQLDTTQVSEQRDIEREESSPITIHSAYVVIGEVRFESSTDSLVFRKKAPYILRLPQDNSSTLDSVEAAVGSGFSELELKIEKLDTTIGSQVLEDQSIVVKGALYDTIPFTFVSDLSEKIRVESSIEISETNVHLLLHFNLLSWFWDEDKEEYLDPNDEGNKSEIEGNIKKSFSIR